MGVRQETRVRIQEFSFKDKRKVFVFSFVLGLFVCLFSLVLCLGFIFAL